MIVEYKFLGGTFHITSSLLFIELLNDRLCFIIWGYIIIVLHDLS